MRDHDRSENAGGGTDPTGNPRSISGVAKHGAGGGAPDRPHAAGLGPRIPLQTAPAHDSLAVPRACLPPTPRGSVPERATWRAGVTPRLVVAGLLLLATVRTLTIGSHYLASPSSDDLISLTIAVGVLVALGALLVAVAPRVVTLEGSRLTVRTHSGTETFDLADALQLVDVVGNPHTSHWAVLLHRADDTTLVLRHQHVVGTELDPIVRHYRIVADRRSLEREARFEG